MNDYQPTTYAVSETWKLPQTNPDWENFFIEYMTLFAKNCTENKEVLIGHLKGLVLFPDGSFFRVSCIDSKHPPTTEGKFITKPEKIEFTLNLILYGILQEELTKIALNTRETICLKWQGEVTQNNEFHHSH